MIRFFNAPFSSGGWSLQAALLLATAFWPLVSLRVFILVSPLGNIGELIGWDPRIYWAFYLGVRALLEYVRKRRSVIPVRVQGCWVAFCAFVYIVLRMRGGNVDSNELESAITIFKYFVAGSLFAFAMTQFVTSMGDLGKLIPFFVFSSFAVSIYGIEQAVTSYGSGDAAERITSTLQNANFLAGYLSISCVGLALVASSRTGIRKYLIYFVSFLNFCCSLLTLSRTGTFACIAGLALVWITRGGEGLRTKKIIPLYLALLLLGVLVVGVYLRDFRHEITFAGTGEDSAEITQQVEDLSRLEALSYASQLFLEHPVIGVGLGTFAARNYDANGVYLTTHNTLMEILTGTGIIGALLLSYIGFVLAKQLGTNGRRLLFPVAGCFAINSMLGDYLQSIDIAVLLSILYLYCRYRISQNPAPNLLTLASS